MKNDNRIIAWYLNYRDEVFLISGVIICTASLIYLLLQFPQLYVINIKWPPPSLAWTYICLFALSIGTALYCIATYENKLLDRRRVSDEEIQTLFSEYERNKSYNPDVAEVSANEIKRLESKERKWLELDILPLRQSLVDLYDDKELLSKSIYELNLLKEYEDDDPDLYKEWKERILDVVKKIDENSDDKEKEIIESFFVPKLRAGLKSLREQVAYYEKTYAEGEVIFKRVMYWSAITAMVAMFIGVLPLIHSEGDQVLNILHWFAFGISGALLSVLAGIHDPSIPELGETKGKEVFQKVILGIVIGSSAAILLYAALSGEILAGKIFPKLPIEKGSDSFWVNTGASIFWGLVAGFSLKIFASLVGIAEGAFGKKEE